MPEQLPPGVVRRVSKHTGKVTYLARPYVGGKKLSLGTFADPLAAGEVAIAALRGNMPVDRASLTVRQLRALWIKMVFDGLAESTRANYVRSTDKFIDVFGDDPAAGLYDRFDAVKDVCARLSATDVANCYTMFEWARKFRRLIPSNPLLGISGRAPESREGGPVILDDAGVRELAACAYRVHPRTRAPIVSGIIKVLYGTAFRPGHACIVERSAVDLDARRIIAPPFKKQRESLPIAINDMAAEGLEELSRYESDYMIFNAGGQRLTKSTLDSWWRPVRQERGLQHMWISDLRDSQTTRLRDAGVDKRDAARQLTHADNGETLDRHYDHPDREDALDRVLVADSVTRGAFETPTPVTSRSQIEEFAAV